ncbi:MAG TPA: efflux RND transporter periplasmic adaptor subunit [Bryobacteraceae bacterium]|nr:efflux RND transporter periplasmic adaptor subunit [Bryobacteraceae bacterium]
MVSDRNRFQGKWLVAGLLVLLCIVVAAATQGFWKPRRQPQETAPAKSTAALDEVSLQGRIQAHSSVFIAAPIEGKIDLFHVEIGQEVSEGQLLAQIKSDALEVHQQEALSEFEQVQARLSDLEASISAARLEASRARAEASRARSEADRLEKIYKRQSMLLEAGATPRLVAEKAAKDYQTASEEAATLSAAADRAEERVSSMAKDADALRKTVTEKSENLESAKTELQAGDVRSPVDGVVVGRRGTLGDTVDRSMQDFFQIATDLSTLEVVVDPPPDVLPRLKPGQPALVRVAELSGDALSGTVSKVENGHAVIEFANPLPEIKPGLTAQVAIKIT